VAAPFDFLELDSQQQMNKKKKKTKKKLEN